jgi:hypothetical protein
MKKMGNAVRKGWWGRIAEGSLDTARDARLPYPEDGGTTILLTDRYYPRSGPTLFLKDLNL